MEDFSDIKFEQDIFKSESKEEKLFVETNESSAEPVLTYAKVLEQLSNDEITQLSFSDIQAVDNTTSYVRKFTGGYGDNIAALPSGLLVCCYHKEIQIWDPFNGVCVKKIQTKDYITSFALLGNNRLVIGHSNNLRSGSWDLRWIGPYSLKVWDLEKETCIKVIAVNESIDFISILPNGLISTVSGYEVNCFSDYADYYLKTIKLWDLESGKSYSPEIKTRINFNHYKVYQIAFLSNHYLACAVKLDEREWHWSDEKRKAWEDKISYQLQIWKITSRSLYLDKVLELSNQRNITVLSTLHNKFIVCASEDGALKVWDPESGDCIQTLKGHTDAVRAMAIFPDGYRVLSVSDDHTMKIWDPIKGDCLKTLIDLDIPSNSLHSYKTIFKSGVAIFPNGMVAIKSRNFQLWNPQLNLIGRKETKEVLKAVSKNKSLTALDLSNVDMFEYNENEGFYPHYWNTLASTISSIIYSHPTLTALHLDFIGFESDKLKELLVDIFDNRHLLHVWLAGAPLKINGKIRKEFSVSNALPDPIKRSIVDLLKSDGRTGFGNGCYTYALIHQEIGFSLIGDNVWKYEKPALPFKNRADSYYKLTSFFYFTQRRNERYKFITAVTEPAKSLVDQVCESLEAVFTIKCLSAESLANPNRHGELILPSYVISPTESLIDDLLGGWILLNDATWIEQKRVIMCVLDRYTQKRLGDKWLAIDKRDIKRILLLLRSCESSLKTSAEEKDFLLLLTTIEGYLAPSDEPILGYKPRQYHGLGYCPELQKGLQHIRTIFTAEFENKNRWGLSHQVKPSQTVEFCSFAENQHIVPRAKASKAMIPIEVQKEAIPQFFTAESIGTLEFISYLSRQLSRHKTLSEVAGDIKIQESGRWENVKAFASAAANLIGALLGIGGAGVSLVGHGLKAAGGAFEELKLLYKLSKKAYEALEASSEMVEILHATKEPTTVEKLEQYIRKSLGESKLTKKDQLIQFASVFGGMPRALELFIQGLVWRYEEQLARLSGKGGQQLGFLVYRHLEHFFQLDFLEWSENGIQTQLSDMSQQRLQGMLEIMWYWVGQVSFLKKENEPEGMELLGKEVITATLLLHYSGYKCLNERNETLYIDVRKIDPQTSQMTETEGCRWGYRNTSAREPIMHLFAHELSQYRKSDQLSEAGFCTSQTLKKYAAHPIRTLKSVPFTWKSELERIVILEGEVKVLQETTVSREVVEVIKENLTGEINTAKKNAATAQEEADKIEKEMNDFKGDLKNFVAVFGEPEGVEREEKIRSEANKLFHKLDEKKVDKKDSDSKNATKEAVPMSTEKPKKIANCDNESQDIIPPAMFPSISDEQPKETFYHSPISQKPLCPLVSTSSSSEEEAYGESSKTPKKHLTQ